MIAKKRPIRRKSLHAKVVHELRELIIGGKLKPGARLVEEELCEMFDISRTPLREAFKVLEIEALVEIRPGRGARVSEFSALEVAELFEVISNIEKVAVELAVKRMTEVQFRRLQRMHERMMKLYREGRRRECFQTDFEIHNFIVAMTGNSLFVATHESLMIRARRGRYLALFSQARWDEAMNEHEGIMDAINRRDGVEAGDLMSGHVLQTGVVIREILYPKKATEFVESAQLQM